MFRLDRDFFEYLKDLSNPDFSSSSDIEAYKEKKKIVRIYFATFVLGSIVLMAGVLLMMLNLPGLFNVTFEVISSLTGFVIWNWPIFTVLGLFLIGFIILYLRS